MICEYNNHLGNTNEYFECWCSHPSLAKGCHDIGVHRSEDETYGPTIDDCPLKGLAKVREKPQQTELFDGTQHQEL